MSESCSCEAGQKLDGLRHQATFGLAHGSVMLFPAPSRRTRAPYEGTTCISISYVFTSHEDVYSPTVG
jgi:hypothetical protein